MTRKMKNILLVLLCMIFVQGALPLRAETKPEADSPTAGIQKFFHALQLIRQHYVDQEKVTYKSLFNLALRGLLKELDPYSVYESEEVFNKTKEETRGEKVGIGVFVILRLGSLEVLATDPESPAEKAGLKPGDMIRIIDGEPVNGKKLEEAARRLQGNVGESVTIQLYRPSSDKHMDLTIERQKLRIRSVTGAKILDRTSGTGYLRITQFSQHTAEDLDKALAELTKQDLQLLIIDLRGNPGGLVSTAVQA
ncbi:MAG: PDZ domain-containing protein, partial [Lentisphaeria bacterium]|nr:PDZ domain-containing protein [Lentisphaeria bacterium]